MWKKIGLIKLICYIILESAARATYFCPILTWAQVSCESDPNQTGALFVMSEPTQLMKRYWSTEFVVAPCKWLSKDIVLYRLTSRLFSHTCHTHINIIQSHQRLWRINFESYYWLVWRKVLASTVDGLNAVLLCSISLSTTLKFCSLLLLAGKAKMPWTSMPSFE